METNNRNIRFIPSQAQVVSAALIFSGALVAYAVPNVFTAGSTLSAAQMNANFDALEASIATLQGQLTTAQTNITALQAKLAHVTAVTVNGYPTVRFSGVNVQVVNGQGTTATANGTGNLIVGYNENYTSNVGRCTVGTNPSSGANVNNPADCTTAGGSWSTTGFKTGSHYLVLGSENNYSRWGGIIAGFQNFSNYDFASVSGGSLNTASGQFASVSGGRDNTAGGHSASVSGGYTNVARANYASVSGGSLNFAIAESASVSGGTNNSASGLNASITGGSANGASGSYASVHGGYNNAANASYSGVSGGWGCSINTNSGWDVGNAGGAGCSPNLTQ